MQKITPFLWFDAETEEAISFYSSIFKDSKIISIQKYPDNSDAPQMQNMAGKVLTAVFELAGMKFMALDGGPLFKFNPAVNFFVSCQTAEEAQEIFNKLNEGGETLMPLQKYPFSEMYGWTNDKYGVSWQVSAGQVQQTITPSLMFVGKNFGKVEEALNFYTSLFENSSINLIARYEEGEGDEVGKIKFSSFTLAGMQFSTMESSLMHEFAPNESVSFYVECADQTEVDNFWNKLSENGGQESQCGWLKDKYGFSWQIVPKRLGELLSDPDKEKAGRVMTAMLKMQKIVIADLEAAANSN